MLFLYKITTIILYPFLIILVFMRKIVGKEDPSRFKEKIFFQKSKSISGKLIWFHVASIGELNSVVPIVKSFLNNNKGLNILIPRDAIGSRNEIDNDTAFIRLILSGALASTTESLICELCKTSSRKEFREISKILKRSFSI